MTAVSTDALENWNTWREIHSQPDIWKAWSKGPEIAACRNWVETLDIDEVWFCGAGTSAYIGDILVSGLDGPLRFRSIPSTDLVSRPKRYLVGRNPLIVNFGRSGNSTETIGTLDAVDAIAPETPLLNITCNKDSALAQRSTGDHRRAVILPDETHDLGFAMTSSFSTMLLTAAMTFDQNISGQMVETIANRLDTVFPQFLDVAKQIDRPERVVFLGAGPLAFAARESALKVLELSAGKIPALWDSTLGFRHGPKSFVTDNTAIFVTISTDGYAAKYDHDLIAELKEQFPKADVVSAGPAGDIQFPSEPGDILNAMLATALAQILAVVWAQDLGLNVDNPFEGQGTLTRVVSGVQLYPVEG